MVLVHPALQNLATRGPSLFQKFVSTRVHNCTVHGPRLKFLLTAFSGRSPGDFANLSCFLHPDICYSVGHHITKTPQSPKKVNGMIAHPLAMIAHLIVT